MNENTSQYSNINSHVSLPRIPNLSNFCAVENPFIPFSTINAVIPCFIFSGFVFAYTINVSALTKFSCIYICVCV